MEILFYIIAGTISGIIAGMGMGGGTFLIPVLTIIFEFAQKTAQGINLLAFLPMAVVSLIIHFKNKLVNLKIGIPIVITGAITSFLSAMLANSISNKSLKLYFGIFLIMIGVYQIIVFIYQKVKSKLNQTKNTSTQDDKIEN